MADHPAHAGHPVRLDRAQVLAHRRRAGALDERLRGGSASLRRAAWVGLQDSMPRAAVLSLHARVEDIGPFAWEDPALVQVWGLRYSVYAVPAQDRALFTIARLPEDGPKRRMMVATADALEAHLDGRRMGEGETGRAMGVNPNSLRYAAPTGRVLVRWDGARQPTMWMVPAPNVDPAAARLELARRHLHVCGPATPGAFAQWAGIRDATARATYADLAPELVPVRTPVGDAWILAADEASFRATAAGGTAPPAPARLLPSGDAFWLCWNADRELLVPDPVARDRLWTPRVWPGALLVAGELVGTWRRAGANLTVEPWRPLTPAEREAVATEGESMPLPDLEGRVRVSFAS